MKYVCIDDGAVRELISGRELQSVDFEDGRRLIERLQGRTQVFKGTGSFLVNLDKDGMYLTTPGKWKDKKYLVVDCESSNLFSSVRDAETLTSLQKLLRFCSKFWSGSNAYTPAEKMIAGTSKTILFPLPFSSGTGFRVAIEREPMKERLERRDLSGNFLLVYKTGFDGANSFTEEASLQNFRKVIEALPSVYDALPRRIEFINEHEQNKTRNGVFDELKIAAPRNQLPRGNMLTLGDWLPRLTKQQRQFVQAPVEQALRLVGAAGTGKTTTLILRTMFILLKAESDKQQMRALFVTPSEATRKSILESLQVINPNGFWERDPKSSAVSLTVTTLASICADKLNQTIQETEFVDRDAQDSKVMQGLYIEQAIAEARANDFKSHAPHLSDKFRSFFDETENTDLVDLFQHEISMQIKGRAGDPFDAYKECPPLKYGLPVETDADRGFVFSVFRKYQRQLVDVAQFDTDDVVLSATGQLDTPIWRRRRSLEGYDFIAIDEAHLFNINELHLFHYFTRDPSAAPISFAIDQAQAVGERGWEVSKELESNHGRQEEELNYGTVFRSSTQIIELSASILASGANLFSNFKDTLKGAQSGFTSDDERRTQPVRFIEAVDDDTMVELAFKRAAELGALTESSPSDILITCLAPDLLQSLKDYAAKRRKPITVLDRRGDYAKVRSAQRDGLMLLGHADYVGGLEFNIVIVVGVDKGRVPYEGSSTTKESRNFMRYIAHNRLYVACSRARFALELLGVKARGPSDILSGAFTKNLLELVE
ncbi:hypothetical protein CO666_22350 [Rhizobium chutanense]|uniref:DNA 3'-5' helicase II n=1 Tax=Rhizobium chutanense TaxID=2035448 RepID=A0A2A6J879_9HYPH|nr:UvrD-helicase domain-containing protein [Rhizobium chutanense]PDT02073.1 hypothetical protein CO666_22350 [Rhizobium chutanense]